MVTDDTTVCTSSLLEFNYSTGGIKRRNKKKTHPDPIRSSLRSCWLNRKSGFPIHTNIQIIQLLQGIGSTRS